MPEPGDVVTLDFVGATGVKRWPAVVVSSRLYRAHRLDLVLAVLTTQVTTATPPTDYVFQEFVAGDITLLTAAQAQALLSDNPFDKIYLSDRARHSG